MTAGVCIVHLIRNTFRLASRRDWDALKRDVKPVYTAVNAAAARAALDELAERWASRYPAVIRLWENAWEEFIPFLDYDVVLGPDGRLTAVAGDRNQAGRQQTEFLVVNFVRMHPGASRNQVEKGVSGRATTIRQVLDDLAAKGALIIQDGNRGSSIYFVQDLVPTSSHLVR